jgi:hypothetical protein
LSTIAFQYYPLDLNAASNPFIVSWWPLALADPALFHVSLQTASLDVELRDRKGFTNSDILMADSVSLIRMKVDDPVRASQDETLDCVVTLAAIEYGKGNVAASKIHIDGVISIVRMRGGISAVKLTNPLTARMVSWYGCGHYSYQSALLTPCRVSMIISDTPVFSAQDDFSADDGIPPSPQWFKLPQDIHPALCIDELDLDPAIRDIVLRLRNIFHSAPLDLPTTDLHDLTCFVLHKLLPSHDSSPVSSTSECVRSAIALYMLIIHGPTYFTHARLQRTITLQLQAELQGAFTALLFAHPSLVVWLLSIGLVASEDTRESPWFTEQARTAATTLGLFSWNQILHHLTEVLWLTSSHAEAIIRLRWELVSQSKI